MTGSRYITLLLMALLLSGCDSRRTGVLEGLLSGDDRDWLARDPLEDPFEWQNGRCCNDITPAILPLDTTISAAINPADDLDYFYVSPPLIGIGLLRISAATDIMAMRLIAPETSGDTGNYELEIDSVWQDVASGTETAATAFQWTYLTGSDMERLLLIQGDGRTAPVPYRLEWLEMAATVGLDMTQPGQPDTWQRGDQYTIAWESSFSGGVSVALANAVGMVKILKRDIDTATKLNWTPEMELTPGQYRILIYLSNDPTVVEVSDVISIQ